MAEFLIENAVHWDLIEEIAVYSLEYSKIVDRIIAQSAYRPPVTIKRHWYY